MKHKIYLINAIYIIVVLILLVLGFQQNRIVGGIVSFHRVSTKKLHKFLDAPCLQYPLVWSGDIYDNELSAMCNITIYYLTNCDYPDSREIGICDNYIREQLANEYGVDLKAPDEYDIEYFKDLKVIIFDIVASQ